MEGTMESLVDEHHADRLRTRLAVLCNNKDLCDVVLTSADGCDIQAHWLVLASSSEYFAARKFTPIIYTDVDISELSIIVNYIYTGKVSVIADKRDRLLLASQNLKLNNLESLILNSSNTVQSSCPQNQENKSLPNLGTENEDNKQSPNLLHAWTKHHKSGTSISSGLPAEGSQEAPVGQSRSEGSLVRFTVSMVRNVGSSESVQPLSIIPASTTHSPPDSQLAPTEPQPVAWNWDPDSSDVAGGQQSAMDSNKLIENVDFKIKEEVLSDEENGFDFFAPSNPECDVVQGDSIQSRSSFHVDPGRAVRGRKRTHRGGMNTGSRMVSETVSNNNGQEQDIADQVFNLSGTAKRVDVLDKSLTSMRTAKPLKIFYCETCNYTTKKKFDLKRHTSTRHKSKDSNQMNRRLFVCDQCANTYKTAFGLKQHQRSVHWKEYTYRCNKCDKGFNFRAQYDGHVRGHSKLTVQWKCPDCQKTFKYSNSLLRHRRECCKKKPPTSD